MNWTYSCKQCGEVFPPESRKYHCACGGYFEIQFSHFHRAFKPQKREAGIWKYESLLPGIKPEYKITLGEGDTPLIKEEILGKELYLKQENLSPTGSFKDRGFALLISHCQENGIQSVVEDSSGNAAVSAAAYAARAGIACDIFVPATTSPAKIRLIESYGASIHSLDLSRDEVAVYAQKYAARHFYASHVWNPLFFEGIKTMAFEIYEQMEGQLPDSIVLPAGNGSLVIGLYLGFKELAGLGLVDRIPKIIAVQATNCAPLYRSFHGLTEKSVSRVTLAEGIAIGLPLRKKQILSIIQETGGEVLRVSEKEIKEAAKYMISRGHLIEPTSAAAIAGVFVYLSNKRVHERILSVITGTGLKTLTTLEKILKG